MLIVSGCSKVTTGENGGRNAWTNPGRLVYAENQSPAGLNPMLAASAVDGDLSMFVYSYAIRYDEKARPVPDAVSEVPSVENGDVSKDGLTLKYKIRSNLRWQDGPPVTCEDFKFTWQAVMNPRNNVVTTDGYKNIGDIDCRDERIAVVHMKKLYAPFLQQLWGVNGNAPVLPKHILGRYNDAKGSLNNAPFNSMPVGSGPFRVTKWLRGSEVDLVANPNFYRGKPKLDRVVFKIVPDENTLSNEMQAHEIDLLARGTGLSWPRYERMAKADPSIKAIRVDNFLYTHVDFNLERPLLQDRSVRTALAHAVDRNEIVSKVMHGAAVASETDQSPEISWAHTDAITHYPFDAVAAGRILDAAGWKVGRDGIRVKNGVRLSFNLTAAAESNYASQIETLLQRQWHLIGVEALIKNVPSALMFQNGSTGTLQGGHYDAALYSWSASADPDDSAIYSGDNLPPHGQNTLFWNNPVATKAMNDALQTLDRPRRKADYAVVQQQMAKDVPTIVLFFWKEPYLYNSDLRNFKPSPVISAFWNPWEYSL